MVTLKIDDILICSNIVEVRDQTNVVDASEMKCLPRNCLDLDVSCSDQAYKRHFFVFGGLVS